MLKTLGYASTENQPTQLAEDIQMHADTLYHRMLEQEKAINAAKEAGLPVPTFEPVVRPAGAVAAATPAGAGRGAARTEDDGLAPPSEEVLAAWRKHLDKVEPDERGAEEQALRADWRARARMAADVSRLWEQEAEERKARKADGKGTWADAVAGFVKVKNAPPKQGASKDEESGSG